MNVLFTFLTVKKLCPYLEEIKFVCKLVRFERDDADNVAFYKPDEFYLHQSDKGICHCSIHGEEK